MDATTTPAITALGGTRFAGLLVADSVSHFYCYARPAPPRQPLVTATASATVRTTAGTIVGSIPSITCFNTPGLVVRLNATDNTGGSGVKQLTSTLSSPGVASKTTSATTLPTSVPVAAAGLRRLTYSATDTAGNHEATHSLTVLVDTDTKSINPFACAAPTPTFSLPAHGLVVLTGTLTQDGKSKPFTRTVKF